MIPTETAMPAPIPSHSPPTLRPSHIAETALYVDDLPRAVEFYTRLFESEVLRRDPRFCALRITADQVLLLFLRGASSVPIPVEGGTIPAHDGRGPLHLCFGIAGSDVDAWRERLGRLGVAVESTVRWPAGAVSLYFRDPDRHAVELATPGLWNQPG